MPRPDQAAPHAPHPRAQVKQLAAPTLADIHQALADFQPNILYIWAGCSGDPDPAVSPLQALALGGEDELLPEDLPELVAGLKLHALVLNLASEGIPVAEIQPYVPHIVRWKPGAHTILHAAQALVVCVPAPSERSWPADRHMLAPDSAADSACRAAASGL